MSEYIEVLAIVEGATEEKSVRTILAPHLGYRALGVETRIGKRGMNTLLCIYTVFFGEYSMLHVPARPGLARDDQSYFLSCKNIT